MPPLGPPAQLLAADVFFILISRIHYIYMYKVHNSINKKQVISQPLKKNENMRKYLSLHFMKRSRKKGTFFWLTAARCSRPSPFLPFNFIGFPHFLHISIISAILGMGIGHWFLFESDIWRGARVDGRYLGGGGAMWRSPKKVILENRSLESYSDPPPGPFCVPWIAVSILLYVRQNEAFG